MKNAASIYFCRKKHNEAESVTCCKLKVLISFKLTVINYNQKVAAQTKIFGLPLNLVWQVELLNQGTYEEYHIKVDAFSFKKLFCFLLSLKWTLWFIHAAWGCGLKWHVWNLEEVVTVNYLLPVLYLESQYPKS